MRAVLIAISTLALAAAGAASGEPNAKKPSLRIIDQAPLTVRGTDFRPDERVKLLVNAGKPFFRAARAGARGGFIARLGGRVDGACAEVVVQAIGARGSRAMVELLARPGCDTQP